MADYRTKKFGGMERGMRRGRHLERFPWIRRLSILSGNMDLFASIIIYYYKPITIRPNGCPVMATWNITKYAGVVAQRKGGTGTARLLRIRPVSHWGIVGSCVVSVSDFRINHRDSALPIDLMVLFLRWVVLPTVPISSNMCGIPI